VIVVYLCVVVRGIGFDVIVVELVGEDGCGWCLKCRVVVEVVRYIIKGCIKKAMEECMCKW